MRYGLEEDIIKQILNIRKNIMNIVLNYLVQEQEEIIKKHLI